jgi:hypothetical protein
VARVFHASCSLGDIAYVICGETLDGKKTNTIEQCDTSLRPPSWQLIETPESQLTPRAYPVAFFASPGQILIFGGWDSNEAKCETVLFDTRTRQCRSATPHCPHPTNACFQMINSVADGVALAMVYDLSAFKMKVIQIQQGANAIDTLWTED